MAILIKKNGNLVSVGESSKVEVDVLANRIAGNNVNLQYSYFNSEITSLKAFAFYEDDNLISISLPNVVDMGVDNSWRVTDSGCFAKCDNLVSVNLPKATSLPYNTFYYCTNLEEVNAPLVTSINNSFQNCSKLKKAIFPLCDSVGSSAFIVCRALEEVDLRLQTQNIGSNWFTQCYKISKFTIRRTNSICSLSSTGYLPASSTQHITIYVPADLITSYQTATNWATLYNNGYIDFQAITE